MIRAKRTRPFSNVSKRAKVIAEAKRRSRQSPSIPRAVGGNKLGFPKQLRMKHRYVSEFVLVGAAGGVGTWQFSTNGLFDPDISGTGHQPMYFDQLAAVYNHFNVMSSKATVRLQTTGGTPILQVAGIYIEDDTTKTPTSFRAMCESNSSVYATISASSANEPLILTKSWDAKQAFGGDILDNDSLQGGVAANPSEQQYFTLFAQDILFTSASNVSGIITIDYDVIWDELRNLAEQ